MGAVPRARSKPSRWPVPKTMCSEDVRNDSCEEIGTPGTANREMSTNPEEVYSGSESWDDEDEELIAPEVRAARAKLLAEGDVTDDDAGDVVPADAASRDAEGSADDEGEDAAGTNPVQQPATKKDIAICMEAIENGDYDKALLEFKEKLNQQQLAEWQNLWTAMDMDAEMAKKNADQFKEPDDDACASAKAAKAHAVAKTPHFVGKRIKRQKRG